MADLQEEREKLLLNRFQLSKAIEEHTKKEVSSETIRRAETGIAISGTYAEAIIKTLNRRAGTSFTRKDFPDLKITNRRRKGNISDDTTEPERAIA